MNDVQLDNEWVRDLREDRFLALDVLGLLQANDLLLAEYLEAKVLASCLLLTESNLTERSRACHAGGIKLERLSDEDLRHTESLQQHEIVKR